MRPTRPFPLHDFDATVCSDARRSTRRPDAKVNKRAKPLKRRRSDGRLIGTRKQSSRTSYDAHLPKLMVNSSWHAIMYDPSKVSGGARLREELQACCGRGNSVRMPLLTFESCSQSAWTSTASRLGCRAQHLIGCYLPRRAHGSGNCIGTFIFGATPP